jgi:hypothetical protein
MHEHGFQDYGETRIGQFGPAWFGFQLSQSLDQLRGAPGGEGGGIA